LEIETKKTFNKSKIKLNVSGSLFVTSYTTLTSIPGTYFSDMFQGITQAVPDDNGEFFIDRNPKYFEEILDYLRKGSIVVDDLPLQELEELMEELKFYKLNELAKSLQGCQNVVGSFFCK